MVRKSFFIMTTLQQIKRVKKIEVKIGNVYIGANNPIAIQSMTNTPTKDIKSTTNQIIDLYNAGSKIVRITVNDLDAAKSIPKIVENLNKRNLAIPLVGCFHYNGHTLLSEVPECAKLLAKYRINPGNVGFKNKRDTNFEKIIECAIKYNKPIRIGVNWGSLDQNLVSRYMDDNAQLNTPKSTDFIMRKAMVNSVLQSAKKAEEIGINDNQIVVSAKLSRVQDLISVYRELSKQCNYPLHLGLTEAGIGHKGIVATTTALSILLQEGIGDTIRASLTPMLGENRSVEVNLCKEILQSLGIAYYEPQISSCPGCGRTSSIYFQQLVQDIQKHIKNSVIGWKNKYRKVEFIKIAVMGCVVNGPGESKQANIGISLPGDGEAPIAVVYEDQQKTRTLKGDNIALEFIQLIDGYIERKCQKV